LAFIPRAFQAHVTPQSRLADPPNGWLTAYMKRPIWLAPLAIMVIGGVWLLGQTHTIRQLEEANRTVKHELANFRNVEDAGSAAMKPRTTALDRNSLRHK
jgi:hypothetical protein